MKPVNCPTCKKNMSAPDSKSFPFCCERCRLIDLGNWLGGGYRIAGESIEGDEKAGEQRGESEEDDR